MLEYLTKRKILLVVAHPDDEVLGPGGTCHKLINDHGCTIKVVILGEGITSRSETRDLEKWENSLKIHKSNIESARQAIGFQEVTTYDFPDNRFDSVVLLDIVKVVEEEKNSFNPSVIFTHHGGDVNIDHQRTFESVITACRPMENERVESIITFETMSGTEWRASSDPKHFIPNLFVEITDQGLNAKIKAMEAYEFEKRAYPHPRSPEALRIRAQMWGITVGRTYAEAFQLIRSISHSL